MLFFQPIREHLRHISQHFPICIRKSNFLTCERGVSVGLSHTVPEKKHPDTGVSGNSDASCKKRSFPPPPPFFPPRSLLHQVGAEANSCKRERDSGGNREICNPAKGSANLCQRLPLLLPRPPLKNKGRGGTSLGRQRRGSEPAASTGFVTDVYIVLSCFLFCITIGNPERGQAAIEVSSQPRHQG